MFRRLAAALASLCLTAPGASTAEVVGEVLKAQMDAYQSMSRGDMGYAIAAYEDIYQNAQIYTHSYGSVQIVFKDDTDLLISPNSSVIIDEYVYSGGAGGYRMTLAKGALRMISGKLPKRAQTVSTAIAAIGVRGTRYWLDVDEPGILKIWTDEGAVVARPVDGTEEFLFEAPVYAECMRTTCQITDPPPKPVKFPEDPRRR